MSWWQNLFSRKSQYGNLRTTGQINAVQISRQSELTVIVAPVTGQLQKIDDENDQIHSKNGFMMLPNGYTILSPVSGIVVESKKNMLTIKSVNHAEVVVSVVTHDTDNARLALYSHGQQLHAGDMIGTISAKNSNATVYVIFEENLIPRVRYGAVYAGQNVWQNQEVVNESK